MEALFVLLTLICLAAVFLLFALWKRQQSPRRGQPSVPVGIDPQKLAGVLLETPKDKVSVMDAQVAVSPNDVGSEEEAETAAMLIQERWYYRLRKQREREQQEARQGAWMRAGMLISADTWDRFGSIQPPTIVVTSTADLKRLAREGVDLSDDDVVEAKIVVYTAGMALPLHPHSKD